MSKQELSFDQLYDQALAAVEKQSKTAISEHRGPSNHLTRYYFGVTKTNNGYSRFICKTLDLIPKNMVSVRFKLLKSCDVESESINFYNNYLAEQTLEIVKINKTEIKKNISVGDVTYFIDGQKLHTSIIMEYNEDMSKMLFITTNPYWNPWSRPISREEEVLLGYPSKGKISYLAPVIRPSKFIKQSGKSFPSHRIDSLKEEFSEDKFIDN